MTRVCRTIAIVLCFLAISPVYEPFANTAAGGAGYTVVMTPDGSVWTWGSNANGQLGDGTTTAHTTPAVVSSLSNVTQVASGASHALALKSDGTVWAWGANSYGQLGDQTTTQRTSPVQVYGLTSIVAIAAGENHGVALTTGGAVWVWGRTQRPDRRWHDHAVESARPRFDALERDRHRRWLQPHAGGQK